MYSIPTSLSNVTCKGSLFEWGEFSFLTKWCFKSRSQLSFLCVWQWLSVPGIPPSETSSWTGGMTSPSAEDIPGRAAGVRITLHQTYVMLVWASVGVCDHRDKVWVSVTHMFFNYVWSACQVALALIMMWRPWCATYAEATLAWLIGFTIFILSCTHTINPLLVNYYLRCLTNMIILLISYHHSILVVKL